MAEWPLGIDFEVRCPAASASGLFYATGDSSVEVGEHPGEVAVGSGLSALDFDWLRGWLLGGADSSETPFEGVRRLMPGQILRGGPDGVRVVDTMGPDVWGEPSLAGKEAVVAYQQVFAEVVADLLEAEAVPRASFLSGGLDSAFVVASVAGQLRERGNGRVNCFTHVPSASVGVGLATGWVASDEDAARRVAQRYSDVVNHEVVLAPPGVSPLRLATELQRGAEWPCYGAPNLVWTLDIDRRARAMGAQCIWTGSWGNAAFSPYSGSLVSRARHRTGAGAPVSFARETLRRMQSSLRSRRNERADSGESAATWTVAGRRYLKEPPSPGPKGEEERRRQYLAWLAGHHSVYAGFGNPGAGRLRRIDPYKDRRIRDLAAQVTAETWSYGNTQRGFAREVMRGSVPDSVRLRPERGRQGLDVWLHMTHHRGEYAKAIDGLGDTELVRDLVDVDVIRAGVARWPWGLNKSPEQVEISDLHRVLCLAAFIREVPAQLHARSPPTGPRTAIRSVLDGV